ncbi:NCA2-domain-containing protein [Gigaspora margarita]|uniref:NCA2-domain-containing protein n=2 Tax=Gigaspora margarita TaxID=4874 RepID=A0A8H4AZC0_GIGMA|nr:NCA2-domain-containing protein [Gigaspora margarita]
MSFIKERVRRLQGDIDAIYQSLQFTITSTSSVYDAKRVEVLTSAIQSIELDEGHVPKLTFVLKQLDTVEKVLHRSWQTIKDHESESDFEKGISKLEWIFLAKITVVLYANLLNHLLFSTLPLLNEIYYWEELQGSRFWAWNHLFQTSPVRLYSFSGAIYSSIRQQYQNVPSTILSLRQYFSRNFMINLFPNHMHIRLLNIQHFQSFSILPLIRYEVRHKRLKLKAIMEHKAACLGLLIDKELNLKSIIKEMNNKEHEIGFDSLIGNQLTECLVLIERVLNQTIEFDIGSGNVPHIDNIVDAKYPAKILSLLTFYTHLRSMITTSLPKYDEQSTRIISYYGRPSAITRWWIPTILLSIVTLKVRKQVHWEDFLNWLEDIKVTTVNFWNDWVWEPIIKMIDTIRHRESRLALMGKESLSSDLESLERMVIDFARDQKQFTVEELNDLSKRIRDGDLSIVLRAYEQELKRPVKATLTGNLIRTLLIQVQKTKVDLELSMTALDKLLKSNELNFAFLAVGPSIFGIYLIYKWIKVLWWKKESLSGGLQGTKVKMRESLRYDDLKTHF